MNDTYLEEYTSSLNNTATLKNDIILANKYEVNNYDFSVIPNDITGGVIGLISPTGTGKTFLLRDILSQIYTFYDTFYMFSGTAKLQRDYDFFPKENIYEFYDEEKMINIWQKNYAAKKPKKVIIILDDVINDPQFYKSKILKAYSTGSRHINITVFLLTQYLNSLKPIIRNNLRLVVTFESDNYKERRKFIDEYLSVVNPRVGDLLYKNITGIPFQCIVIAVYKKDKNNKIYKYIAKKISDNNLKLVNKISSEEFEIKIRRV